MLLEQLLNEARYDVIDKEIQDLTDQRTKAKEKEDDLSSADMKRLKLLKSIKQTDLWKVGADKKPAYGPALSSSISIHREVVLRKVQSGKIVVGTSTDGDFNGSKATFSNTEQGYKNALKYYISLTR